MPRRYVHSHLASLTFVLLLGGCWEENPESGAPDAAVAAQGGSTAVSAMATGGGAQAGASVQAGQTGGSAATGGTTQAPSATTSTGGSAATGGSTQAPSATTATGGNAATGGSTQAPSATTATGGNTATGGTTQALGGTTSAGGTSAVESLCFDEAGAAVPSDYTTGIMSEYAYELSMSCDIGGYLAPLIAADPDQLTQVDAFVTDATDWYRADILKCRGATTQLDQNSYGLLPVSQSSNLSDADFDSSAALFLMVLNRHDGQPDGVSADKKDKIMNRIKSVKSLAVHDGGAGLTKTLSPPDCVPADPTDGGA